ncbi:hypothetical protein M8J76_015428 [Diaphorina citri]|nr:hypothetical protein M8J76_015428 [Diaphorina citri]
MQSRRLFAYRQDWISRGPRYRTKIQDSGPLLFYKPVSDKNKGGEILILEEQDTTSSEEPKTKISSTSSRRFKEQNKLLSATKILQVWQPMFHSTQGS